MQRNLAKHVDSELVLKDGEFAMFQKMMYDVVGINMSDAKKALVKGRLLRRLKHYGLASFADYFALVKDNHNNERQTAIDLLTTNETYFFREPRHFDLLRDSILTQRKTGGLRIWSAASSTGEEAYTLAMLLSEHASTGNWEVVGTDISTRVLEKARSGHYPLERGRNIPDHYRKTYCLRGTGTQEGTFIVGKQLRSRVKFLHANLMNDLGFLGEFDVVFLRNVLIYFDTITKQRVVANVVRRLKPQGHLIVGHSENLNGITDAVEVLKPSIYRKI